MMVIMKHKHLFCLFCLIVLFTACREDPIPRPRGYFRIDLPEKIYQPFDTTFPFAFEYPVYAKIKGDPYAPDEPYWININFPQFKGSIHISYKVVNDTNLASYLEDSRKFVVKHIPKAQAINDSLIYDTARNIYGLLYEIRGTGAASPFQFFVTDSTDHFVRGALYFNIVPNNDSLAPVIDFLKKDIQHMIQTFRWK